MQRDPLDAPATPDRIGRLAARGELSGDDLVRAYAAASATPSRASWALLVDRTLLVLGALLVAAGVIFFFAFNWAKLPSFGKFGILVAAIVLAVGLSQWRTLARRSGRMALVVAAILVGPLLAVYGQTYQTGADPYELFLAWAVLATPWAIAARSSLLWGVLIALVDTTAVLFAEQVLSAADRSPWREGAELPMIFAIHAVALAVIELVSWKRRQSASGSERALARVVALVGAGVVSLGASWWILDQTHDLAAPTVCLAAWPVPWTAMLYVYRRRRRDLAMLAIAGASVVAVVTTTIAKATSEATHSDLATVFLAGLNLTAEVAVLALWLRAESKREEA